jgi:uncharacterized membrane protein
LEAGVTATAVGSGVMGGVLFAFSSFVMPALRRLPAREAVLAMQSINERAPQGLAIPLIGTALGSIALGVHAVATRDDGWELRLVGAGLYLVAFGITIAYHVPRNNALDAVDADGAGATAAWAGYVDGWVRWNHARTAASVAAAAAYVGSLLR